MSLFVDNSNGFTGGEPPTVVRIEESVIKQNHATRPGNSVGIGGGVELELRGAKAVIENTTVAHNSTDGNGGGVYLNGRNGGQVELAESRISGNTAGLNPDQDENGQVDNAFLSHQIPFAGGGIYGYLYSSANQVSAVTISRSEISDNTAGLHGGGIAICTKTNDASPGELNVSNSTISGNKAGDTTSDHFAGKGGGAYVAVYPGPVNERLNAHFQNVTITNNSAFDGEDSMGDPVDGLGGGIYSKKDIDPSSRNNVWLTNSIASANDDGSNNPSNLYGSFNVAATRYNLIGSGSEIFSHTAPTQPGFVMAPPTAAPFDTTNTLTEDPQLMPLAFYGGPTRSHMPEASSPAIDMGDTDAVVKSNSYRCLGSL